MTWECAMCKSVWPALTTLEADRNRVRAHKSHPKEKCRARRKMLVKIGTVSERVL